MVEMSFDLCHLFQKQLYWRTPSLYENGSRRWKRWVGKMATVRKQSLDWFLVFIHCHNKMWSVSSALLYILYVSISDPSQRWKRLENGTLKNKASLWQSTATWNFEEFNKTLIKIKDNAANKFLGAQSDGKVVRKDRRYNEEDQKVFVPWYYCSFICCWYRFLSYIQVGFFWLSNANFKYPMFSFS